MAYLSPVHDVECYLNENEPFQINIYLEETSEGFDTNIDVYQDPSNGVTFTLGKGEKKPNAEERAKQAYQTLSPFCDKVFLFKNDQY